MIAVPLATPPTTPVVASTVAIVLLLLLQLPPVAVLLSVVVLPGQSAVVPVIVPADGIVLIVTDCVATAVPHVLLTE